MIVILFSPQIPQNTGNIVRTCKVTGSQLILVRPLGFSVTDKELKRAGLDYWDGVSVTIIDDLEDFLSKTSSPFYFFSSHATCFYSSIPQFPSDSILIFGSETTGLPPQFLKRWPERFYTLPMMPEARCLNLSNAVAVVLYKAWEQQNFKGAAHVF